jgi:hypothetical protein
MRTAILRILTATAVSAAVVLPAAAKPRGCFTKAEHNAERTVRHGIFLREMAFRCDVAPFSMKTKAIWLELDDRIGEQFKRNTDLRQRAFEREFEGRAEQILHAWDGRLVMQHRHMFLTKAQCDDAKKALEEARSRGFQAIRKQAEKVRNEVYYDYKLCN